MKRAITMVRGCTGVACSTYPYGVLVVLEVASTWDEAQDKGAPSMRRGDWLFILGWWTENCEFLGNLPCL
jgi:hypothetical protein